MRFAPHLLDAVDETNYTPLMDAVSTDSIDAAKILLRTGADVRKKNKFGWTVFDEAHIRNKKEMLQILNQHQQVRGIF